MSLFIPKNYKNGKSKPRRAKSQPNRNQKSLAIEECKKLYQKYCSYPPNSLLNQINKKNIKIFFESFTIKDITIISQLLSKYFFLESIIISPSDPDKPEEQTPKRQYKPFWIAQEEKIKRLKEKKLKKEKAKNMFNKLIFSLAKHVSNSKVLISLSLNNLEFNKTYCQSLYHGLSSNNSLQNLSITNSKLDITSYEIILESLLNHTSLSFLDLSDNKFSDKYGKMISRIIVRHAQRRDHVIWYYSLRNELPSSNEYKKGLMFINLNRNNLSKDAADCITNALYSDQYIRAIYLNNNKFDNSSCKKFIYMMRKNLTILTIDLRENPGYKEDIHHRLVMKMSKNIRYLFQQYKVGEYTENEFEQLKEFIDVSFFDVEIPQNVVEFYNNNVPLNTTDENDNDNDGKNNNVNYRKNIKTDVDENKMKNSIKNKILNNEGDIEVNKNYATSSNFYANKDILEENKKLFEENIKLKQQIVELRAKNLKEKIKKDDNATNINNKKDETKENSENKKNEEIFEDDYTKMEMLINELNDLMNKIEEKKMVNDTQNNKEDENIINENSNLNIPQKNNKIKDKPESDIPTKESTSNNININNKIMSNQKREEKNINNKKLKKENNIENNKDKESSDDSHFIDEDGNIHNINDLTDEEKMVILQQQFILQKLQEEAEARGEQFDPQEYINYLEKEAREEEEEEDNDNNKDEDNKLNKSF